MLELKILKPGSSGESKGHVYVAVGKFHIAFVVGQYIRRRYKYDFILTLKPY